MIDWEGIKLGTFCEHIGSVRPCTRGSQCQQHAVDVLRQAIRLQRESLADLCHEQWCGWMKYLFLKSKVNNDGSVTIPADSVRHWTRQIMTPYDKLSKTEKNSDRDEADKFIKKLLED